MNNKFKRIAAFALAMTIITGGSTAFNAGVGGLSNYTGIVASARGGIEHILSDEEKNIDAVDLVKGDTIIVGNIDDAKITYEGAENYYLSINKNESTIINQNGVYLKKNCEYAVDEIEDKVIFLTKQPHVLDKDNNSVDVSVLDKGDIITVNYGTAFIRSSNSDIYIFVDGNISNLDNGCTYKVDKIATSGYYSGGEYFCDYYNVYLTKINTVSADDITADLVFEGKEEPAVKYVKYNDEDIEYDTEKVEGEPYKIKIVLKGNYSGEKVIEYGHTPAKEPTHNTNGNVEYWTYNDVNYIKENGKFKKADNVAVPSTSINSNIRVQTSRIEPTSEKDGYIITKIYCADCGKLISYKRVRIPKLS